MDLDDKKDDSPPLPPTPSREKGAWDVQAVDDSQAAEDSETLGGDDVLAYSVARLWWNGTTALSRRCRCIWIKKMRLARQGDEPEVLRSANEKTSAWKTAPWRSSLNFNLCISSAVKSLRSRRWR